MTIERTVFLLARYAEEQAIAEQGEVDFDTADEGWLEQSERRAAQLHTNRCGWRVFEGLDKACACDQPARTLAEIESKREILNVIGYANSPDEMSMAEAVERWLLEPYALHPEFDARWLP